MGPGIFSASGHYQFLMEMEERYSKKRNGERQFSRKQKGMGKIGEASR